MGDVLFATGRDDIIAAMERLSREQRRNGGLIGFGGRGAAGTGRIAGIGKGAEASRNSPYAQDFNNAYADDYRLKDELSTILMESGQASQEDFQYYAEMLQDVPEHMRADVVAYLQLQQERASGNSAGESRR